MEIKDTEEATLIFRENRFLGNILLDTRRNEKAHIHDPGRLKELLYPGAKLLVQKRNSIKRKTKWEVIAADKDGSWTLINTSFHRFIAENYIQSSLWEKSGNFSLKAEVTAGSSRLDFLLRDDNGNHWIEVKGCTLRHGPRALFPDAPTKRGTKHIKELISLANAGDRSTLLILIFDEKAVQFAPNRETDPKFADAFSEAEQSGVRIIPACFSFDGKKIYFQKTIPYVMIP